MHPPPTTFASYREQNEATWLMGHPGACKTGALTIATSEMCHRHTIGMSRANSIKSRCIPYRHAQQQRHVSKVLWGNGDAKEHGYQPPYTCWCYTNGVTHAWRISLQLPSDVALWFYGWNNGLMRVGIGQEHIGRSDGEEKLTPRVHQGQQRVWREATIPVKQEKLVQTGQNVP